MILNHPYFDTLSSGGHELASEGWLPNDLTWRVFVSELLDLDEALGGYRLLRLFVRCRRRFHQLENLDLVTVLVHNHAAHSDSDIRVTLVLKPDRIDPVVKVDSMYAFIRGFS